MTDAHETEDAELTESDFGLKQSCELAGSMDHWLDLFDCDLRVQEVPLSQEATSCPYDAVSGGRD